MNNNTSAVKRIRKARGLTRKEVAERSGINFRSLQDYEQGHKDIASAKSDTLFRLSLTLGCYMEELLQSKTEEKEEEVILQPIQKRRKEHSKRPSAMEWKVISENGLDMMIEAHVDPARSQYKMLTLYALLINEKVVAIESYIICSPQYNVYGRWKMEGEECYLIFYYDGELVRLPFPMDLSGGMIEWLKEVAGLKIDYYIRRKGFEANGMMSGGSDWDES